MKKTTRAVLITGGATRIGRQIALEFATRGWAVAIHYNRSLKQAEQTLAQCKSLGATKAALFQAKLEHKNENLIERVTAEFGGLGCLVNNASRYEPNTLKQTDEEDWDKHFAVNAKSPFFLMKHFAASLPKGATGSVVNITDQRVLNLTPFYPAYSLSKASLEAATKLMAMRLAPNVRVNAVAPGHVLPATSQTPEEFEKLCKKVALKRAVAVEDVAEAVVFLALCQSITGQTLAVDSGQHLGWRQPFDNDKIAGY